MDELPALGRVAARDVVGAALCSPFVPGVRVLDVGIPKFQSASAAGPKPAGPGSR